MAVLALIIATVLVVIDQLTKIWVVNYVKPNGEIEIISDFFYITYVENKGAAFGILQDQRWVFISLTIILIIMLIYGLIKYKINSKLLFISIVLIVGGGIGNLIDRIFLGYVVDFIYFTFFPPVFNFADCCVTVGACLLPIPIIFFKNIISKKRS